MSWFLLGEELVSVSFGSNPIEIKLFELHPQLQIGMKICKNYLSSCGHKISRGLGKRRCLDLELAVPVSTNLILAADIREINSYTIRQINPCLTRSSWYMMKTPPNNCQKRDRREVVQCTCSCSSCGGMFLAGPRKTALEMTLPSTLLKALQKNTPRDPWNMWSERWWDMTCPAKRQWQWQRQRKRQSQRHLENIMILSPAYNRIFLEI